MTLPYLGGAAAVWTTCLLFFQAMLLVGYIYAHLLGRISNVRVQSRFTLPYCSHRFLFSRSHSRPH